MFQYPKSYAGNDKRRTCVRDEQKSNAFFSSQTANILCKYVHERWIFIFYVRDVVTEKLTYITIIPNMYVEKLLSSYKNIVDRK